MTEPSAPQPAPGEDTAEPGQAGVYVALGVALLIFLLGGVMHLLESKPNPAVTTSPTPSASASATAGTNQPVGPSETLESGDLSAMPHGNSVSNGKFAYSTNALASPAKAGEVKNFIVRVETGLKLSANDIAKQVEATLSDDRSWGAGGAFRFNAVTNPAKADFAVYVVTPGQADSFCAPIATQLTWNCLAGNRIVLNSDRWTLGAPGFVPDAADTAALTNYRTYLINHMVGHWLGHKHETCTSAGSRAPIMLQQDQNLNGCTPSQWVR